MSAGFRCAAAQSPRCPAESGNSRAAGVSCGGALAGASDPLASAWTISGEPASASVPQRVSTSPVTPVLRISAEIARLMPVRFSIQLRSSTAMRESRPSSSSGRSRSSCSGSMPRRLAALSHTTVSTIARRRSTGAVRMVSGVMVTAWEEPLSWLRACNRWANLGGTLLVMPRPRQRLQSIRRTLNWVSREAIA